MGNRKIDLVSRKTFFCLIGIPFSFRIMEKSIDSTAVDKGPLPNNNVYYSLYYVIFVVVYSFFFLNIFVALIIVTFQEQGEKEITGSELDKNQVRLCRNQMWLSPN